MAQVNKSSVQWYFHCMRCGNGVTSDIKHTSYFITDCQHMICKGCLPTNDQICCVCKNECKIKFVDDPAIVPLFADLNKGRKLLAKVAMFRETHDKAVCHLLKNQINELKAESARAQRSAQRLQHEYESRRAQAYGLKSPSPAPILPSQLSTNFGYLWSNDGSPHVQGQVLYKRQFYTVNQHQDPGNRQTWVPYDEAASKEQQTRYSKKTKNEINREYSRKFSTDRKNDLENRSKAKVYIFASNGYPRSDRQEIIRNQKN